MAVLSLWESVKFLQEATQQGHLANIITVLQGKSDPIITGALLYGSQTKQCMYSMLSQILNAFLGGDMEVVMAEANTMACKAVRLQQEHWFQESAISCSGWQ